MKYWDFRESGKPRYDYLAYTDGSYLVPKNFGAAACIVLDGEGGMRGGEKGTAYTQWGVAHEDMLIFKGKRDGKEVSDTAMLDVNSVPIRVKVDKTGTTYVMKQVPVKDK